MNNIQQLLESSNQFKVIQDDAKKLAQKWSKSGLLEGIKQENERSTMAMLLENQAKQLLIETNGTGGTTSMNGGNYNSENWAGVALPLVRRVFGDIAAKEFISVQPMNLPSGLVFYLDFKFGNTVQPFRAGDSLFSANPTTNVTDLSATSSLYEAGRFNYSMNPYTASSLTAVTGAVALSDINYDTTYTGSVLRKFSLNASSVTTSMDANAIRSFVITSGSTLQGADILQQFTTYNSVNGTITFIATGSAAVANAATGSAAMYTLYYSVQPTPSTRGDYEDGNNSGAGVGVPYNPISIPEIQVQLKSEPIVAKTRKLKAQWTPEFAQDLNAYQSVDAEAELTGILSQYISMEIDLELLDMLIQNAYTVDYWSAVNNTAWTGSSGFSALSSGYYHSQGGWFQTLGTKLQKVSNKIHQLSL